MEESVVEHNGVTGKQAPFTSEKQKERCVTCGSTFANKANLSRHKGTNHADQSDPKVVAKALKLKDYRKTEGKNRRDNDPVHREKLQLACRKYKMKRKVHKEAEEGGTGSDVNSTDVSGVMDMDETHIIEDSIEDKQTQTPVTDTESDHMTIGSSSTVKKADKNDASVFDVKTKPLTKEDMKEFFTPKWAAPRTKEQRKAEPFGPFAAE